jgi:prepilin-type N-terminal cleavage/methylation domain-containing protein
MITFNKNASQSGRSMIEMLGVLAIVGILSAGGIAGYSMAMAQYKTNLLIERVQLIVTRARTIYKNGNYTGISNQNLIDSGKLSAKDLENPFGGNLTVRKTGGGSYLENLSIETDTNVPKATCIDILTMEWNDIRNIIAWGAIGDKPTTISDAKSRCLEPSKVTWHFK